MLANHANSHNAVYALKWLRTTALGGAVLALCLVPTPLAAQSGFQTLSYPGAVYTIPYSINNSGAVVGEYWDGAQQSGFLFSDGQFTSINVPGAAGTIAFDINDAGQIVGVYSTFDGWNNYIHGFVLSGSSFSTFDVGFQDTWAYGINNHGDVVGSFTNVFDGAWQGFKRGVGGGVTVINVPGSEHTTLTDINDDGLALVVSTEGSFHWADGSFSSGYVNCPLLWQFSKINNSGRIVGTELEPYICSPSGSRTYMPPVQAAAAFGYGLNDNGMIVGAYWTSDFSQFSGFIAPVYPLAMRLTLNAFLPFDHIVDPHPFEGDKVIEGDGAERWFDENGSSRVSQIMDVRNQWLSSGSVFLSEAHEYVAISQQYEAATSLDSTGLLTYEARNDWEEGPPLKTAWGTAVNQAEGCSGHVIANNPNPNTVSVAINCYQDTPNGVYPAWLDPSIVWEYTMAFVFSESETVSYSIAGCRKHFPSYEIWAAGQLILAGWRSDNMIDILIPCGWAVPIEQAGTVVLQ